MISITPLQSPNDWPWRHRLDCESVPRNADATVHIARSFTPGSSSQVLSTQLQLWCLLICDAPVMMNLRGSLQCRLGLSGTLWSA